jgi:putative aminopeptidase FrvX
VTELDRELLQELLWAYGPCGQEDAVRDVCHRELEPYVDELWVDEARNLVGLVRGQDGNDNAAATKVMAHLDELSMLVKRVEPDGSLHVTQLGTMYPANFGLGPVAVLGDRQTLCGVLAVGSEHTTEESHRIWETKPDQGDKSLDWMHVYVFTGRTPEELAAAGVGPGTRVCVERSKRNLVDVGDFLASYFMDDRASITALLQAARMLRQGDLRPAGDVFFVFTTNEEIGGVGGAYPGVGGGSDRGRVHHEGRGWSDRRLQRRAVRLRQGRRRSFDGHRERVRVVPPGGRARCLRIRRVACHG